MTDDQKRAAREAWGLLPNSSGMTMNEAEAMYAADWRDCERKINYDAGAESQDSRRALAGGKHGASPLQPIGAETQAAAPASPSPPASGADADVAALVAMWRQQCHHALTATALSGVEQLALINALHVACVYLDRLTAALAELDREVAELPDELASLARMLRQGMSRKEAATWADQIGAKIAALRAKDSHE